MVDGTKWKYQYAVDGTAQALIDGGIKPEKIESSSDLAADPERRIKFQRDVQRYVDHAISSTINLPAWGSDLNNEDKVEEYAKIDKQVRTGLEGALQCTLTGPEVGSPSLQYPMKRQPASVVLSLRIIQRLSALRGYVGYEQTSNREEFCRANSC